MIQQMSRLIYSLENMTQPSFGTNFTYVNINGSTFPIYFTRSCGDFIMIVVLIPS